VITCRRDHLEERCRQRGYTMDEVRPCIVAEDGDTLTVDEAHAAYPRQEKPGLGDMVAAGLSAVGVTKERVQRAASAVGINDCGCAQRQRQLNAIGRRIGIG